MDEMTLKMTRADWQLLLKHVFIGNWVLTATKDSRDKALDDFNQSMLKFMKTNQIEDRIEKDKGKNLYFVSEDLENAYLEEIDAYNEDIFIEELIDQLTKKDLVKTFAPDELERMSELKFNKAFDAIQEKYIEEIGKNGMKNIDFIENK